MGRSREDSHETRRNREALEAKDAETALRFFVGAAFVDGRLSERERAILEEYARKLRLSSSDLEAAIAERDRFIVVLPESARDQTRLFLDLVRLVASDGVDERERRLLERTARLVGFKGELGDAVAAAIHAVRARGEHVHPSVESWAQDRSAPRAPVDDRSPRKQLLDSIIIGITLLAVILGFSLIPSYSYRKPRKVPAETKARR